MSRKYQRIFIIVIDSLGTGAMDDAASYNDAGADTLGHISSHVEQLYIPHLQKLGLANLHPLRQVALAERPAAYFMKLHEASAGKDTITGHWEMMGLPVMKPLSTFPNGFPQEIVDKLENDDKLKIIRNS